MFNFRALYVVVSLLFISVFMSHNVNAQTFPNGLIGLSSNEPGVLYSIDASNGIATPIVTLNGGASLTGLAYLHGTLYGTDLLGFPGGSGSLDIGSISTGGIITFLGDQNGSQNWWGLASDEANGILYAIDNDNSNILTAQFPDGSVKTIGSGVGFRVPGMEYDDTHGILFAISDKKSLYTISTETGTATLIGPTGIPGPASPEIGLAYDECSQILYANDGNLKQLYTLVVTTGEATLVGSNSVDAVIDGLAWKGRCGPNPIPTLSEWGLIAMAGVLGIAALLVIRRRKAAV
jgi:hypothetical protein